jgi:hypothetical protein
MSTALALFHHLCALGTALAQVRDIYEPCSDTWTALTCLLQELDTAIDILVRSRGLGGADDA